MKTLLQLQEYDVQIEECKAREAEIPRKKEKFNIHKKRLAEELADSENRFKKLQLEQRTCEGEIEAHKLQIGKYSLQLNSVKKNEEYNALLNEIELIKKQIGIKEERIIQIMMELDDAKVQVEEDKKRINAEQGKIDADCREIDQELADAISNRKRLEEEQLPLKESVAPSLMTQYMRIKKALKSGKAAVPISNESCSGCFMKVRPQVVNELLAGKIHNCQHCGRLLYDAKFHEASAVEAVNGSA